MSVKFIENSNNGRLGCWEITEETGYLLSLYNPAEDELKNYLLFRNDLRKREWLATRLLLQEMTDRQTRIVYDPAGKPVLVNYPGHVSISHSSGFVVICYHPEQQPGIDIELITRNIERMADRFLSSGELSDCSLNGRFSNKDLMLRWCAKEAVFKMVPDRDIDFASQIACAAQPLNTNEGVLTARFTAPGKILTIPLQFRCIGDLLMVWGFLKD